MNEFVVTANTTTPSSWTASNPVSVQSLDNVPPAQPTELTASYSGGQTHLQWAANTEPDLGTYRLYRGASSGFIPSPGSRIASPTSNSYSDPGPAGSYYKLSAEDVNGNESSFALVTPEGTTGVGDPPVVFALAGVHPNPTRGNGLHVAFALPTGSPARLELLDVAGRQVLARPVGSLGIGRHAVNLRRLSGAVAPRTEPGFLEGLLLECRLVGPERLTADGCLLQLGRLEGPERIV